jgi:putative SOS response-associated peptidase YedK
MCGRFTLTTGEAEVAAFLEGIAVEVPLTPRYNIAPTQDIAVVVNSAPPALRLAHWGLIPAWAKDRALAARMINARAETVHEKPAFRKAFKSRRCLILADGFYEWQAIPGSAKKQPIYFRRRDAGLFAMAGLWERWRDPEGETVLSTTIVTTAANATLADFHHRMPVILDPRDHTAWLATDDPAPDALRALLAPCADDLLEAYPVSTRVNRPSFDDPACVERVSPA